MLKVVFVFAEKWISDRYAGSIVTFCKAFNVRRSSHEEIQAGNDTSRDPEYWLATIGPESLNIESISGLWIPNGR
jgi:hypothetical protein